MRTTTTTTTRTTILTVLLCALLDAATASTNDSGVINLKLNPRHVELERRRRERKLSHRDNVYDFDYNDEEQPKGLYDNDDRYRRREEAMQIGALFEGYGTHYVDLWVGSPPQRQTVIVDTGSGITAFPCSGCRECGVPDYHIDRLFVEEESTTFDKSTCSSASECIMDRSICNGSTCSVTMAYAEGSRWSAYEAVDQCYIAGPHETPLVSKKPKLEGDDLDPKHAADLAFDMTFGCQTVVTGLFKTQLADGIMGMSNQRSTYWSQMFAAEKMGSERQFALCFSRPPRVTREGTEAGAMTLGGVDDRLHDTPMVYTPRFDTGRRSFFSVNVRRMMLREGKYGESAMSTDSNPNKGVVALDIDQGTVNRGGTIVDSGTTDTYFNSAIAAEFKAVFKKISGYDHNNRAIKLNAKQFAAMPTILIQLESDDATNAEHDFYKTAGLAGALDPQHPSDVILAIPPSHYMEYNPAKDEYTSRFYPTEHSGNVLGANAMMGHNVFFDVEQTRIGWAESACDYTRTVENNGYDFEITGSLKEVEELSNNKKHNNNNNNNNHHHQNSHMHNQQLHNQHRHQQMVAAGNGVNSSHHNAVVSAALSAAVAANRGMNVNGTGNAFHRTNGNSFHHAASNPPWMQPPLGYKQGLGAQMARENLAAGQSNSRTAAAGRALLEGLGGGRSSSAKGGSDSHSHSHSHSNGSSHPASNSGMMAMAELQRRANSMQMGFGHQSAQNILAALTSGNGSSHSLAQMARNASNGSFGNIMMKSGISRDQLSQLAQNRGLSSASLSTMAIDGRKNSFDQLMSLDFQSLQSIDNLANLIQTGGGGQAAAPSSGMKNWSADVGGMNGGNAGAGRFGSTASLSNAARRLASQNNFETLMRNLSSTNNMSRTGLNHEADAYGEGNSGSNNGNANSASGSSSHSHSHPFGQSSTANLQSLLHSMNSGNGGSTSMSSILGGNNHSAASLANLLQRADNSATGLSALRNPDGLGGRNTTSVEDFLSLVAAGDIPHQDPAVLNLPLSQLQQQQLQQHGGNAGGSNNHNGDPRQGGNTGGNAGGNNENERSQRNHKSGQEGRHGNDHAAASILAQATGNTALANALASRSFGSNLGGSFADFSRTNLSSLGSTAELLQQLADSGGGSSSSNLKRKLLDVDGALEAQGVGKR
mmetsp:Transcript_19649/g.45697  ORF Transcript_19649/g.45697 Transcript_19649/m.45697 type:complete len:1160 (-) Transcript_19649:503-3982(-)